MAVPKQEPASLARRLSIPAASILLAVGLAYHAYPFLRDYYSARITEYPQGYDLWTYSIGADAFYAKGADPYDNRRLAGMVKDGTLSTDFPDKTYDRRALTVIGGENMNGYLGSPFVLALFHFLNHMGFALLKRIWPVFSLLAVLLPLMGLTSRLAFRREDDATVKTAILLWTANLLVWDRAFWVHTILHGQIDALYLAPVLFGFLLLGPGADLRDAGMPRIIAASALFAFAACVKVFPAIILIGYLWIGFSAWFRSFKEKKSSPLSRVPEIRLALIGFIFVALLAAASAVSIARAHGDFFTMADTWRVKVDASLHNPTLVYRQNNPHMAPYMQNYLLYLLRVWMKQWDAFGDVSIRLVASALSFAVLMFITWRTSRPRRNHRAVLTLFIAALPTLLPHWWNYYNVFLLPVFIYLWGAARHERRVGKTLPMMAALVVAYVLMMGSYVAIGDLFKVFPNFVIFMNGHPTEFVWYFATPYNLLFGYPGNLLLLLAAFYGLRLGSPEA